MAETFGTALQCSLCMRPQSFPSFKILPHILLTSLLFPATITVAGTHLRDGSYVEKWTDLEFKIGKLNWSLDRTYNSRSLYRGFFGFGWCSELDQKLIINDLGPRIQFCDNDQVDQPVRWHNQVNSYVAEYENHYLVFQKNTGLLIQARSGLDQIQFQYDHRNRPSQICSNKKCLSVHYLPMTDLIQKINSENGYSILYNYSDDDLVLFANSNQTIHYKYDYFHNLIQIHSNSDQDLNITYDDRNDLIQSIQKGDLLEKYDFYFETIKNTRQQFTMVHQYFRKKLVFKKQYAFEIKELK